MNPHLTADDLLDVLADFLRGTRDDKDRMLEFDLPAYPKKIPMKLPYTVAEDAASKLASFAVSDETILHDGKIYEVLVNEESSFRVGFGRRSDSVIKEDPEHRITYTIGAPSDEYLLFALYRVSRSVSIRAIRRFATPAFYKASKESADTPIQPMAAIRSLLPRIRSLKIQSALPIDIHKFSIFSTAFLFQLSYNLNVSYVEERSWNEIIRISKIAGMRRSSLEEIEPPKCRYIPDLIFHYQMAISSDNPVLQYLSYYHIAEHFFDELNNEEMLESIRLKIVDPGFSTKRRKDLSELVAEVKKRLLVRGDTLATKELDGLKLALKKYVDLAALKSNLENFDSEILEYYRTHETPFSRGDTIDFNCADASQLIGGVAGRIYKTRNSIVHSKEGEKARYTPFKNDDELGFEIPLIRFIGEAIIIKTSKPIE